MSDDSPALREALGLVVKQEQAMHNLTAEVEVLRALAHIGKEQYDRAHSPG